MQKVLKLEHSRANLTPQVYPAPKPTRGGLFIGLIGLLFLAPMTARAQTSPEARWWTDAVERALGQAGTNRSEMVNALVSVPSPQRRGLVFLIENMPGRDLRTLASSFLLENVALAYQAWQGAPWASSISEDLFLNEILPYANINETREGWRQVLREKCASMVADCKTPAQAAQRLNERLFQAVNVRYSTKRKRADQSPSESMETGLASCTGLSILLVDACRSVGVPARLVGIPNWIDNRGNHTWVEVWDERWHFTGAAEPDGRGLDHAWFEGDAARAERDSKEHAIYAASFRRTNLPFPMVWARGLDYVSAVNVTDHYTAGHGAAAAPQTRLMIKVLDRPQGERVAAKVEVSDASDSSVKFEGSSRGESSDANDILSFEVAPKRTYKILAQKDSRHVERTFASASTGHEIVEIYLDGSESAALLPASMQCTLLPPAAFSLPAVQTEKLQKAFTEFFQASPAQQAAWTFAPDLEALLASDEAVVRRIAWNAYQSAPIHGALRKDFEARQVRFDHYLSPFTIKQVGQKPEHGWPLFIAMHGGGGTAKEVNDSQWRVMQRYYRDQNSVPGYLYLALRAPNDTWNGFYDSYVYPLVGNLIRQCLLFAEVDPNKVFLIGYSHGDYGAFAIGPKMPDHFAAIHSSAAAPTDGLTAAKNLRNTVFTFMIGENDHAYGRIERCRQFQETIAKLRGDRTDIYPVTMEYEAGFGHGGLPDRDKIKDMYPAVRNPVPPELTWELTGPEIHDFFWLETAHPAGHEEIDAFCHDNNVTVTTTNASGVSLLLDRRLVDFSRPVRINVNGQTVTRELRPSLRTLARTLAERGDVVLAFTVQVDLDGLGVGRPKVEAASSP
jgi:predicted esterase